MYLVIEIKECYFFIMGFYNIYLVFGIFFEDVREYFFRIMVFI